ncbi:MAG: hypothetical protein Q8K59_11135 [Nitrosomonas sp.]|nr:hypothetical protein [Nitrosomonas sp.]MDP1951625.1 hypothetical protein [Nitrosomonas sp.]
MQAQIEIDGVWQPCELFSPHNQPPAKYFLPGGIEAFQPVYTQYNAKLEFPFPGLIIPTGVYKIRISNKIIEFSAEKSEGSIVWGNVP